MKTKKLAIIKHFMVVVIIDFWKRVFNKKKKRKSVFLNLELYSLLLKNTKESVFLLNLKSLKIEQCNDCFLAIINEKGSTISNITMLDISPKTQTSTITSIEAIEKMTARLKSGISVSKNWTFNKNSNIRKKVLFIPVFENDVEYALCII